MFPSSTIQTILSGLNDIHELSKPVIFSEIRSILCKSDVNPSLANEISESVIQRYPFFSLTCKLVVNLLQGNFDRNM